MNDTWNLPTPPGFAPLRDDAPLTKYTRRLPHWRQPGATYFVTFRLADSLPAVRLRELRALVEEWSREPTDSKRRESLMREMRVRTERWLDEGHGECELGVPENFEIVRRAREFFDDERYQLGAHVVMPNHVHVVVRPFDGHELETILQSWKRYTASEINRGSSRSGALWRDESFDRIVRDEEHLWRTIQYVGRNPALAGLERAELPCWVRPEWVSAGWGFSEETRAGTGGLEIRPTNNAHPSEAS